MSILYRIPVKFIRIYLIALCAWSILGLLLFPAKPEHLIITFATATMYISMRKYRQYRFSNSIQTKVIAGCAIFSLIAACLMIL